MDISDVQNKEEFFTVIINELKTYGVKYQKEKKKKYIQKNSSRRNIFFVHLHLLDLTEVVLASGKVVQVPKIVAEACNRILEQVETEGLFRKAGSFVRQKEIRISLEAGEALGKSHHVIDVANVIKYFFRELPEPLIPPTLQETLIRSLLIRENNVKAILLACLMLPPLTINTLSFFLQFLYTVSLNENHNKMSVENLAIIFTPGLMPFPNVNCHRFTNHVKVVRILIENANALGTIPKSIEEKLEKKPQSWNLAKNSTHNPICYTTSNEKMYESAKKKKKRRSGSLNYMLQGFKKIVGSAIGSSEFLENTHDRSKVCSMLAKCDKTIDKEGDSYIATPSSCVKNNKRKYVDSTELSAKQKDTKKTRLSLGGVRHIKNISLNPVVTSVERRWSVVGTGWSKNKINQISNMALCDQNNCNFVEKVADIKETYDVVDCKIGSQCENSCQLSERACMEKNENDTTDSSCCIQVSKADYEAIKERVANIESHISNKLNDIRNFPFPTDINGAEHVQAQYERTVTKTEGLSSPSTEQLARCLSRGLNIRRSVDQRVIRSPSARKIGTIRRRSQDKTRLSREASWHVRSSGLVSVLRSTTSLLEVKNTHTELKRKSFYDKSAKNNGQHVTVAKLNNSLADQWMAGEDFFGTSNTIKQIDKLNEKDLFNKAYVQPSVTPLKCKNVETAKTPMLPPKSLPKKINSTSTPLTTPRNTTKTCKLNHINRVILSTPANEEVSGRASIARLRSENAGMVLAKAKLFDGLGCSDRKSTNADTNSMETNPLQKLIASKSASSVLQTEVGLTVKASKGTPNRKTIQKPSLKSPASSSNQKHRGNCSNLSQKQVIKSLVSDNKFSKRRHLNERNSNKDINCITKADTLKTSNQVRGAKSPRRMKKNKNRQQLKLSKISTAVQYNNTCS